MKAKGRWWNGRVQGSGKKGMKHENSGDVEVAQGLEQLGIRVYTPMPATTYLWNTYHVLYLHTKWRVSPLGEDSSFTTQGKGENYQVCSVQYCVQQL